MKLKNYLSLSYLVYFLFVVSFMVMTGIIGYLMFQNIMGYSEKSHAIVYSHPIILSSDQDVFTTFNQDDLTIQLYNSNRGSMMIFGKPKDHVSAYLYHNFVYFFEKFSLLCALFWGSLLFRNFAHNNYFNAINIRFFFLIGWTLFLTSIFYEVLNLFPKPLLTDLPFREKGFSFYKRYTTDYFMTIGLISIVFGYVFKEATRIHEEQKLTV